MVHPLIKSACSSLSLFAFHLHLPPYCPPGLVAVLVLRFVRMDVYFYAMNIRILAATLAQCYRVTVMVSFCCVCGPAPLFNHAPVPSPIMPLSPVQSCPCPQSNHAPVPSPIMPLSPVQSCPCPQSNHAPVPSPIMPLSPVQSCPCPSISFLVCTSETVLFQAYLEQGI